MTVGEIHLDMTDFDTSLEELWNLLPPSLDCLPGEVRSFFDILRGPNPESLIDVEDQSTPCAGGIVFKARAGRELQSCIATLRALRGESA